MMQRSRTAEVEGATACDSASHEYLTCGYRIDMRIETQLDVASRDLLQAATAPMGLACAANIPELPC